MSQFVQTLVIEGGPADLTTGCTFAKKRCDGFVLEVLSYALSASPVFKRRHFTNTSLEFASFIVIGILGLCLNQARLWGMVTYSFLPYTLTKFPAAVAVLSFNVAKRRALLFSPVP
jgi:hypothetical protein